MRFQTVFSHVAVALFVLCLWQIEEVLRSIENGWAYHVPWGFTYDYWFAETIWFILTGISFAVIFVSRIEVKK